MKRDSEYESLMWDRWAAEARRLIADLETVNDDRTRMQYVRHLMELTNFLNSVDVALSLLLAEDFPASNGLAVGEDAARAAAITSAPTPKQMAAIKEYTKDGWKGTFTVMNTALRKTGTTAGLPGVQRDTDTHLDELFKSKTGVTRPIRLYRGITKNIADQTEKIGAYVDQGYSSATTSLAVALDYTKGNRCILVIDLHEGYRAASLAAISSKPHEVEVLLHKDCTLTQIGCVHHVKIREDSKEVYTLIHVSGGKNNERRG